MALPYEKSSTGDRAINEIQKVLRKFGCQQFGSMVDDERKEIRVYFKYRNRQISIPASMSGYAAMWLKEHPYSSRMRKSKIDHEREAMNVASIAVYSILRDYIKGQITAVETGILSFEGCFLGQILIGNTGKTFLELAQADQKLLPSPEVDNDA